jgi:hypothetical protein
LDAVPALQPTMPRVVSRLWQGCLPPLFRVRYQSQTLDRIGRALHAMGKVAKQIDPEEMDLPEKPPGMHWSRYNRLAERFENQNNIWTMVMLRKLGIVLSRK